MLDFTEEKKVLSLINSDTLPDESFESKRKEFLLYVKKQYIAENMFTENLKTISGTICILREPNLNYGYIYVIEHNGYRSGYLYDIDIVKWYSENIDKVGTSFNIKEVLNVK